MASIREIAEIAHVAPGTVSRTLNNKGYISEETRRKVMDALQELDYTPNELARSLSLQCSMCIGIMVEDINHPYFSALARHIGAELKLHGYRMMLCSTELDPAQDSYYWNILNGNLLDGMIACTTVSSDASIQELSQKGKSIVMLDRKIDGIPVVHPNYGQSGRLAAQEFLRSGCRHVLQFRGDPALPGLAHERHRVMREILVGAGVEVTDEVLPGGFRFAPMVEYAREMWKKHPETDGIFAMDVACMAFLRVLYKAGVRVPEECRVIATDGSFDNFGSVLDCTSVVQPLDNVAHEVVRVLLDRIRHRALGAAEVVVDVHLHRGETTLP